MDITTRILDKAKEAFIMAIEIYNKPSIRYRVEGFSMFICNAWELMLKAYMIEKFGEASIYHKDNKDRTFNLENCIRKVFTNNKDPLRKNLEKIIELRNTSTHYITEEYEMVYIPLFQACIINFTNKINEFHDIDLTEIIPQNFLTLSVSMKALNASEIRAKYPEQVSSKLIETDKTISGLVDSNNDAFGIRINHYDYLTKNRNEATEFVHIDKDADASAKIIREIKNPNETHKYNAKKCISEINRILEKTGLSIRINRSSFDNFMKYYGIKQDEKLCFVYQINKNPTYSYSRQTIDFIVDEIKKDPECILENIKTRLKKKS
ncbi:MAG: DUF3644 domain-containing protein [Flexilinea sp.]